MDPSSDNKMQEHGVNVLDNFISGWYLNDLILDEMVQYHKNTKYKYKGLIGSGEVDINTKDSTDCLLEDAELKNRYVNYLQKSVDKYIERYPYSNIGAPWKIIQTPQIQHYEPGQGYHTFHSERDGRGTITSSRHLVFMTYLNDVLDGGETEYLHQKIKIKPEKGLTLIWPTDWTFTHRGLVSRTQDKYIITGWFNYV